MLAVIEGVGEPKVITLLIGGYDCMQSDTVAVRVVRPLLA